MVEVKVGALLGIKLLWTLNIIHLRDALAAYSALPEREDFLLSFFSYCWRFG